MRALRPVSTFVALAAFAALAVAAPVLAGGVAIVVADDDGGVAVTAGDETITGFKLLQHGVSPVDFGTTTVVYTDVASGETFRVTATPVDGQTGRFEAAFVYPRAGWWAWHVEHGDLLIQSEPAIVGIFGADGQIPGFYPDERGANPGGLVAQDLATVRLENAALRARIADLTAASAASAERASATEGRLPVAVTVIGIAAAALAGLGVGLGATRLATRTRRASPVREIAVALPADAD